MEPLKQKSQVQLQKEQQSQTIHNLFWTQRSTHNPVWNKISKYMISSKDNKYLYFFFSWVAQTSFTTVQIQFQLGHSSNYNFTRSMLGFQVQHLMSQPNCMIKVRLLSCHNQNGRQPQPKCKTTSPKMEDDLTQNVRRPKMKNIC